jgi:hypothetical protein
MICTATPAQWFISKSDGKRAQSPNDISTLRRVDRGGSGRNSESLGCTHAPRFLPNSYPSLTGSPHPHARLNIKGLVELGDIRERPVYPPFSWRVKIAE